MKKFLVLSCMFIFSFAFVSCGNNVEDTINSYMYGVQINFHVPDPTQPTTVPVGQGATFSVTVTKNGEHVDSSDVAVSTFKDSGIGNLRIWNDSGTIDIQSNKISKKYGEITDCKFGAVSGTGEFGLKATYKGNTVKVTFRTN